mmetsp:Transcript_6783/g.16281  ORF Transcript_6783/g.16281 Transcript_6783/m.16281 type:complete len:212 (+) Transcript_6783:214-849(+)
MMSPSRSTPSVAASEWGSTRRITLRSLTSMPSPLSPRRTATVRFSCLMLAPPSMAETVRAVARCDLPCAPSFFPRAPPCSPPAAAVRCAITSLIRAAASGEPTSSWLKMPRSTVTPYSGAPGLMTSTMERPARSSPSTAMTTSPTRICELFSAAPPGDVRRTQLRSSMSRPKAPSSPRPSLSPSSSVLSAASLLFTPSAAALSSACAAETR